LDKRRSATLVPAYLATYVALGWALFSYPTPRLVVGSLALLAPAFALVVVIIRRRSEWFGCQRLFWDGFAVGATLWIIGYVGRLVDTQLYGPGEWPGVHTVFTLSGGIAPVVALMARPHRGVRLSQSAAVAITLAAYALLGAFVYGYFVFVPTVVGSASWRDGLQLLGQATRLALVAGAVIAAYAARHTAWRRTYVAIALGGLAAMLVRAVTPGAPNSLSAAGTLAGAAWLLPFLACLWAAMDAPASPSEPDVVEGASSALLCAVPAILMPIVATVVPVFQSLGPAGDSLRSLLTGVMSVGAFGLLALRLSAQGGALQRADERARLLGAALEQTGDAIVITRANGTIEYANDAFLRGVGYSRDALTSLRSADLAAAGFEMLDRQLIDDLTPQGSWRGTLVRRRRDGSSFHASSTVVGLRDQAGRLTHLVAVERDITEDLKRRDQLVHAERLSAIGALVAGIAHEINNPLQTILGTAEVLLEEQHMRSDTDDLEVVRREAARAAHIVRNLLSFVRRSAPHRSAADLNEIARAAVELREYHLERSNMRIEFVQHRSPLPVLVNREEILQIILNLILNSEQALDACGGGTIRIRTFVDGDQYCVEVSDDGPGVSSELRGKIFEPFFTTKEVGQGTGLGLSISHGIAMSHGGALDLCPERAGGGACFTLRLPADAHADASGPAAHQETSGLALVIDDEIPIRRLLTRLLERRGFEVVEAESGADALALARDRNPRIVVCDIRMPGMTGIDVFQQLTAASPHMRTRFVFTSGDSSQTLASDVAAGVPVLRKPFTSADLDAVLATVAR
jgi:PAS domain S-box-containing protein